MSDTLKLIEENKPFDFGDYPHIRKNGIYIDREGHVSGGDKNTFYLCCYFWFGPEHVRDWGILAHFITIHIHPHLVDVAPVNKNGDVKMLTPCESREHLEFVCDFRVNYIAEAAGIPLSEEET